MGCVFAQGLPCDVGYFGALHTFPLIPHSRERESRPHEARRPNEVCQGPVVCVCLYTACVFVCVCVCTQRVSVCVCVCVCVCTQCVIKYLCCGSERRVRAQRRDQELNPEELLEGKPCRRGREQDALGFSCYSNCTLVFFGVFVPPLFWCRVYESVCRLWDARHSVIRADILMLAETFLWFLFFFAMVGGKGVCLCVCV